MKCGYLNFSSCVVAQPVDWLLPPTAFGLSGFLGESSISHRELHTDLPSPRAAWLTPGIQPIPRAAWWAILLLPQFFRIQPSFLQRSHADGSIRNELPRKFMFS